MEPPWRCQRISESLPYATLKVCRARVNLDYKMLYFLVMMYVIRQQNLKPCPHSGRDAWKPFPCRSATRARVVVLACRIGCSRPIRRCLAKDAKQCSPGLRSDAKKRTNSLPAYVPYTPAAIYSIASLKASPPAAPRCRPRPWCSPSASARRKSAPGSSGRLPWGRCRSGLRRRRAARRPPRR